MKPGRNNSCPCGSGKKYKHCCLISKTGIAESPEELTWRRLRRELEGHPAKMFQFVVNIYGPDAIDEAWDEFWLGEGEGGEALPFESDTPHLQIFMPWFFHAWAPDSEQTSVSDVSLHERNPTQVYLERKGAKLDPSLRRYLTSCVESPFSFYEILQVEPGRGFRVCDVFTGKERDILERAASMTMETGDLFYGLLAETDGITLLEACPPCAIPPQEKIQLVELRRKISAGKKELTDELLWLWDIELREIYLDIMQRLLNLQMPTMQNTDGESMALQQMVFDIESADAAFDALCHLALGETRKNLLAGAKWKATGGLSRVEFPWSKRGNSIHANWDNTVLGHVTIDEHRLMVDVNSDERAAAFRDIVEQALGEKARYRVTKMESLQRAWDERHEGGGQPETPDAKTKAVNESPQVQEMIKQMIEAHYESWVTEEIPALGNRTPLAAVANPDGREQVEALLKQFERNNEKQGFAVGADAIKLLRKRLGLE